MGEFCIVVHGLLLEGSILLYCRSGNVNIVYLVICSAALQAGAVLAPAGWGAGVSKGGQLLENIGRLYVQICSF